MRENLELTQGLVFSQRVLLALTRRRAVAAGRVCDRAAELDAGLGRGGGFSRRAEADPEVREVLSDAEIEDEFDLGYHTKHVDTIFRRVFGEG